MKDPQKKLHTILDTSMSDIELYNGGIPLLIIRKFAGPASFSDDLFSVEMFLRRKSNKT